VAYAVGDLAVGGGAASAFPARTELNANPAISRPAVSIFLVFIQITLPSSIIPTSCGFCDLRENGCVITVRKKD
jgi:hypothetical protein